MQRSLLCSINDVCIIRETISKPNPIEKTIKTTQTISSVLNFGIFVELENTVEGMVRIENLPQDNYVYDAKALKLSGSLHEYRVGDKLKVKVVSANVLSHLINFEIVGE